MPNPRHDPPRSLTQVQRWYRRSDGSMDVRPHDQPSDLKRSMSDWLRHWKKCNLCGEYHWYTPAHIKLHVVVADDTQIRPKHSIAVRLEGRRYLIRGVNARWGDDDIIPLEADYHPRNLLCGKGFRLLAQWEIHAAQRYFSARGDASAA